MGKLTLVLLIACGVLLGQIGWEIIGLLVEWAGKFTGWLISNSMKKALAAKQAQAMALSKQRPPVVLETGTDIEDMLNQ